jgi:hypothetical protein
LVPNRATPTITVSAALAGIVMAEEAASQGTWWSGEMSKQRLGMLFSRRPGDAGATIKQRKALNSALGT